MDIPKARKVLAVLTVAVLASCMLIVVIALTPSGTWLDISGEDALELQREGSYVVVDGDIVLDSDMPYRMEDLSLRIVMTDDSRGSHSVLLDESGIDVPAHGSAAVHIHRRIPAEAAILMARDRLTVDGAPLEFRVTASCGYLLGLADFTVDAVVEIPVAEDGGRVSWSVTEDTGDAWALEIDGLRDAFIPDDRTVRVSGGGGSCLLSLASSDGIVRLAASSSSGLDGVLQRMSSADDLSVEGEEWTSDDVRIVGQALDAARGLL